MNTIIILIFAVTIGLVLGLRSKKVGKLFTIVPILLALVITVVLIATLENPIKQTDWLNLGSTPLMLLALSVFTWSGLAGKAIKSLFFSPKEEYHITE